jgi:hypothetical protein
MCSTGSRLAGRKSVPFVYSIVKNYNPPEAGTQWRARISGRSADWMRRRNLYRSMAALASG